MWLVIQWICQKLAKLSDIYNVSNDYINIPPKHCMDGQTGDCAEVCKCEHADDVQGGKYATNVPGISSSYHIARWMDRDVESITWPEQATGYKNSRKWGQRKIPINFNKAACYNMVKLVCKNYVEIYIVGGQQLLSMYGNRDTWYLLCVLYLFSYYLLLQLLLILFNTTHINARYCRRFLSFSNDSRYINVHKYIQFVYTYIYNVGYIINILYKLYK